MGFLDVRETSRAGGRTKEALQTGNALMILTTGAPGLWFGWKTSPKSRVATLRIVPSGTSGRWNGKGACLDLL